MAYSPTNWVNGDLITDTNLNKIEEGLSSSNIVLHATKNQDKSYTINDATAKEIMDAGLYGSHVSVLKEYDGVQSIDTIDGFAHNNGIYSFYCGGKTYTATEDTANPTSKLLQ